MADDSKISWTDHTFNPWMGCMKVGDECRHCYADTLTSGRMGLDVFGARHKRQRTSTGLWKRPAKWNRESERDATSGEGLGRVHRVFCASLADVFEDAPGPNEWRDDVWSIIRATPWLDYQLLTKRPELVAGMLPEDWGEGWPNVWLGTSIGHRETVERARVLAGVPAFRRFISYEPAIGPVFFDGEYMEPGTGARDACWADDEGSRVAGLAGFDPQGSDDTRHVVNDLPELELDGIHWLICGGESGPGHRPMDLEWAKTARLACRNEGVEYFFKQTSGARPGQGEDALGEVVQEFPGSWDREGVATHPVYAEQAGAQPGTLL